MLEREKERKRKRERERESEGESESECLITITTDKRHVSITCKDDHSVNCFGFIIIHEHQNVLENHVYGRAKWSRERER